MYGVAIALKTCTDCGRKGSKQYKRLENGTYLCRGKIACHRRAFYQLTPRQRAVWREEHGDN